MGTWSKYEKEFSERYIEEKFKRCPLCRESDPEWVYEYESFLREKEVIFTSSKCHGVLSCSQGDIRDVSGGGWMRWFHANSYSSFARSVYGKKENALYIRVKQRGNGCFAGNCECREYAADELKEAGLIYADFE